MDASSGVQMRLGLWSQDGAKACAASTCRLALDYQCLAARARETCRKPIKVNLEARRGSVDKTPPPKKSLRTWKPDSR